MTKSKTQKLIIVGVVILIIIIGVYLYSRRSKEENFTGLAAGANNNIGTLLDDQYDLVQSQDYEVPSPNFADLVESQDTLCDYKNEEKTDDEEVRPMERLHRLQGKALMPRVSTMVTPYNVDVANPVSSKYMVNTPRVETALQSRFKDYSMASFIRGDIPITYNPNVPVISKTFQGRDDQRLDGLFTPHFNALYNKYTGKEFKNLPQYVAGAGQASGYGGASGGVIMDNY